MKDGLLPVVAVTGAISVALLWTISVNDPYWRLFDSTSLPASSYETPDDQAVALASATLEFGNSDTRAASPSADPLGVAQRTGVSLNEAPLDGAVREADEAAIAEPMIALPPPFEPELMRAPEIDPSIAYALPRAPVAELVQIAPETESAADPVAEMLLAFAPKPLPVPPALRDRGASSMAAELSGTAPDPFVAPGPPDQPRLAADESTEFALDLHQAERIDIQRRLALAGFDPSGFDGTFGPRTRNAISDFQTAWGFPATGYLEAGVYADLSQRTDEAYRALQRQAAAAPSAAPELAPVARERLVATAEEPQGRCARRSDGRIIERQSLACDLAGFSESFVSLGRNTIDESGEGATDVASNGARVQSAGAER